MNKENIEIKILVTCKEINELLTFMERQECKITVPFITLAFVSKEPEKWMTQERKKEFEIKFNEDFKGKINSEHVYYTVDSIKHIV